MVVRLFYDNTVTNYSQSVVRNPHVQFEKDALLF